MMKFRNGNFVQIFLALFFFVPGAGLLYVATHDLLVTKIIFNGDIAIGYTISASLLIAAWFLLNGVATVYIDPYKRTWTFKTGFFKKKVVVGTFEEIESIVLDRIVVRSKNSEHLHFRISLSVAGAPHLLLDSTTNFLKAHKKAEALAKKLQFPLEERTNGDCFMTSPEELDLNIKDRAPKKSVDRPTKIKSKPVLHTMPITFTLPTGDYKFYLKIAFWVALLGVVIAGSLYYFVIINLTQDVEFISNTIYGIASFPLLIALGYVIYAYYGSEFVLASSKGISVKKSLGFLSYTKEIQRKNIEDIQIRDMDTDDSTVITVRGDDKYLAFGEALDLEEQHWIIYELWKAVVN